MLVKALYAISKTTGFLAKTLDKGSRKTEKLLEKDYLDSFLSYVKKTSGEVVEKAGYAAGKIEDMVSTKEK
jgi:hypothetical protein